MKDVEELEDAAEDAAELAVVAIGGSTGWRAAASVVAGLPARPGFAIVVLAEVDDLDTAVAELRERAKVEADIARDDDLLVADRVYVVPAAYDAVIRGRRVRLLAPPVAGRARIDRLFRSLADDVARLGTAVVMSGEGVDGSIGVKRVKEAGGLVVVQAPEDAECDRAPRAAIATGLPDLVLRAADMAPRLVELAGERATPLDDRPIQEAAEALRDILALVRIRSGHDFSAYKRATLLRRIGRRMQVSQLETIGGYLRYLREQPGELSGLLRDLLISVTNFFRDPDAFAVLADQVVPRLFAGKHGRDQVRVWVAGCASGEEAYTLAMLLSDHAQHLDDPPQIVIFATDIDEDALAEGRAGRYPDTIAADVPRSDLDKYFAREGSLYRVRKELRELVLFSPHNVLRDPPFSRLDLVSCRNLLIYLNRAAQDRVLGTFHFALRDNGYLLLGSSESAEGGPGYFTAVDAKQRIYGRGRVPAGVRIDHVLPSGRWQLTAAPPAPVEGIGERALPVGDLHHRLVELYAPPSVVVDDELDIVHLSEHANRFLTLSGGEPTRQLIRLAHPALRLDLRTAIYDAKQPGAGRTTRLVRFVDGEMARAVEITVQLVDLPDHRRGLALVMFDERGPDEVPPPVPASRPIDPDVEPMVRQLEDELHRTRDHLRSTIEQYEASLEELKASNEELHAINEELRSATEELETSKEELQSVNEELTTLNLELKLKVDEITRANSDLQNLMTSTDIAVVFLDRELHIKRFTERARDLFNVIGSDIGRPIDHVTHRLDVSDLGECAGHVLQTLRTVEREVRGKDGRRYLARILPYRSLDDRIEGVVLTFLEVSKLRRAEDALRDRDALLRIAERAGSAGFWELHVARREFKLTTECARLHGLAAGGAFDLDGFLAHVNADDRYQLRAALDAALARTDDLDVEYRVADAPGSERWVWTLGRVLGAAGTEGHAMVSGISVDVTDAAGDRRARRE
jgi:two-component system CheB/CheR fusion protein